MRRTLGQVPGRCWRGNAGLGARAVQLRAPKHRPVDGDRLVRLDDRGKGRRPEAGDLSHVDEPTPHHRHGQQRGSRVPGVGLVTQQDPRVRGSRIGHRDASREERPGRALGEVSREEPVRVRAGGLLLCVGAAVAIRVARGTFSPGTQRRVQAEPRFEGIGEPIAVRVERVERRTLQIVHEHVGERVRVVWHERRFPAREGEVAQRTVEPRGILGRHDGERRRDDRGGIVEVAVTVRVERGEVLADRDDRYRRTGCNRRRVVGEPTVIGSDSDCPERDRSRRPGSNAPEDVADAMPQPQLARSRAGHAVDGNQHAVTAERKR